MDVLGRVLLALIQLDTCLVGSRGAPTQRKAFALQGTRKCLGGYKRLSILSLGLTAPHLATIL